MPISYNNQIKAPGQEINYTPEQLIQLAKCQEDFTEFSKYITIVHPDHGRITFEPYEYQKKMLSLFEQYRYTIILSSRQSGKCVHENTKIKVREKNCEPYETTMKEFFTDLEEFQSELK